MGVIYKIFLLVLVFGLVVSPYAVRAKTQPLAIPDVFISSENLAQADTLLVVVKNESSNISGRLGLVKLRFFRNENGAPASAQGSGEAKDWIAIVGMPVNKKPGNYTLTINVPDKKVFTKKITVAKRKFPITVLAITPKLQQQGYTAKKIISTITKKENISLNRVLKVYSPVTHAKKPFISPLSEVFIVGRYGDIRKSGKLTIQHLGVDLKAPVGTPVLAVNDGKVVFTGSSADYGNTLIVDHGLGVYSLYLHLSEFQTATDQMVKQGDTIALSGDTGYVTGPHLHFSIKIRGASVDPLKFIEATQASGY